MPKEEGRPVARISSVMSRTSISSPSEPRPMKPAAGPAPPAKPEAARPVAKAKGELVDWFRF